MKNAKKRAPSISIRWQLMFFIGAMTLLTVGLIWGIITYALAPKYNATIRQNLTNKASAITAIFDQTDSEISSRDFGVLQLDDDFWTALGQTFSDKKINMDGYCVDFSDSTLRCLKAYESMFPCLLHESSGSFSGEFGYNLSSARRIFDVAEHRRRHLPQFLRKAGRCDIDTDADDQVFEQSRFCRKRSLGQYAAELFPVQHNIVDPFDLGPAAADLLHSGGNGHGGAGGNGHAFARRN